MKISIWVLVGLVILAAVIIYFVNKNKSQLLPQVIVNKLPGANNIVINKKPGEQWTLAELKTQGYTDQQIKDAQDAAASIGLAASGF